MSADRGVDPEWGDDLMAIADAVAEPPAHPELTARFVPHPSYAREFTNLALELLVKQWAEALVVDPVSHEECRGGCGTTICGCDAPCLDAEPDLCGHDGAPFCPDCAHHWCVYCRADQDRWNRPDRGEDQ